MSDKKKIQVVTIIIAESTVENETSKALTFKSSIASKFLVLPKSQIYNFEKVETWFKHWKGRFTQKALKFDIPLWLYEDREHLFNRYGESKLIVKNTHKK